MPTSPAVIVVTKTPVASVTAGFLQITARTRKGKDGKDIPADQRSRSILIQEFSPNVSSKYAAIVVGALTQTAKAQLEQQWADNPSLSEVYAASYTEDALLLFAAREAEGAKLSAERIREWWQQSALRAEMLTKYSAAQLDKFLKQLENIAAPGLTAYNEETALKRMVSLGKHDADSQHVTVVQMIARLDSHVKKIQAAREELGDVAEIEE
jgi:hypothetical protein